MNCPYCGSSERTSVKDTRATPEGGVSRRRFCPKCEHHFTTVERVNESALFVRKSDGGVVAFDRGSLQKGIEKAAVHRLDLFELERLVAAIVAGVYRQAEGPVDSVDIGDLVLRHLRDFQHGLHIRFALVQAGRTDRGKDRPGWTNAAEFRRWLIEEYPEIKYYRPPHTIAKVVKRSGRRVEYAREKLEKSVGLAAKGRGSQEEVYKKAIDVAMRVEQELEGQAIVTTGQLSAEVLRLLRSSDHVAYLRYAGAVKDFKSPEDYEAEALPLRPPS